LLPQPRPNTGSLRLVSAGGGLDLPAEAQTLCSQLSMMLARCAFARRLSDRHRPGPHVLGRMHASAHASRLATGVQRDTDTLVVHPMAQADRVARHA